MTFVNKLDPELDAKCRAAIHACLREHPEAIQEALDASGSDDIMPAAEVIAWLDQYIQQPN